MAGPLSYTGGKNRFAKRVIEIFPGAYDLCGGIRAGCAGVFSQKALLSPIWEEFLTDRQKVATLGGIAGLAVSGAAIVLLWFRVSGVLIVDHTNLMHVFWPTSVMLVGGGVAQYQGS